MKIHSDKDVEEKILDYQRNEVWYVEWLCQNKTEKQLISMSKQIDKFLAFAQRNNLERHVVLINLWKDHVEKAMKYRDNYENLYIILKKLKNKRRISSYERMFVDHNFDWFNTRLYNWLEENSTLSPRF